MSTRNIRGGDANGTALSVVERRRCDFCSAPDPTWRYPATSFTDAFGSWSIDDWLACDACHRLIEAGARDALARRSLKLSASAPAVGDIGWNLAFAYVRQLHDQFWRARTGAACRIAA